MDPNGIAEIVDFSVSLTPKRCRLNDDILEFAPALPLGVMEQMVRMGDLGKIVREQGLEPVLDLMSTIMLDESFRVFKERIHSKVKPIDALTFMRVMNWLLEEYGLRPTEPSSPSSTSSSETGMTSTAGVLAEASTHSS